MNPYSPPTDSAPTEDLGMPDAKPRDRYESWYILTLMFLFMLAPGAVLVFVALYWNRV